MFNFFYNLKQSFIQIGRNKGMSFASFFAITAMLLILGIFLCFSVNINLFTEIINQDYDTVEVFLKDSTSRTDAEEMMKELKDVKGVTGVTYRTKTEALEIMKERWGDSGYLLDSMSSNPLPNSILVKVSSLNAASRVNARAGKMKGVESTKYYKETVDKLTRITRFTEYATILVMAFLVIVSVVVVSNTIKLTVFARAKEISIMKYVGATNWFIRGPFLIEGITIGVLSSLAAAGAVYFLYDRIVDAIGMRVMTILSCPLVSSSYMLNNLVIIFLALGISIGACGSIVSMRKFLDR